MADLRAVWELAGAWDREQPRSVELDGGRAQLYMGAMEIPLIAVRPRPHVQPLEPRVQAFVPTLTALGLVLDTVEVDRNYKINRIVTNDYVARILPDALKLHCARILGLGPDVFERIVRFYLALPRV